MKVLAYIPLHYGKEYLSEAIKAIHNHVEKIVILYSSKPSFGHGTTLACPDTREEMYHQAKNTSHKVEWVDIDRSIGGEGAHRELVYQFASGYDLILAVDADEVWNEADLARCLSEAQRSNERYYGILGFVNFYRSFNTICLDHFAPIRITKLSGVANTTKNLHGTVYHFGYAQRDEIMKYKWSCHGHQDELRKDWMSQKYFGYQPEMTDLHPVAIGLWNPSPFDKANLPDILKGHPNYNKEIIN
jgi:hypothetical protein